jgi:hypothetical protein
MSQRDRICIQPGYARVLVNALFDPVCYLSYDTRFPSIRFRLCAIWVAHRLMTVAGPYLGFISCPWDGTRVRVDSNAFV